jgi:hypothetical protein
MKDGLDLIDAERQMLAAPQVEIPTFHYFGPGIYIREIAVPAGTLVIGHSHKAAHLCVLQKGRLAVIDGDGNPHEMVAPHIFTAPPGRKVGYAVDDVVFQNVFATEETDIEKLEEMLIEKSAVFLEHEMSRFSEIRGGY